MSKELEIICIDDEPEILEIYSGILENEQEWPVIVFKSPVEAKAYIEKRLDHIGAIICDYKMSELDGLTLLNDLSFRFGALPFILISGFIDARIKSDAKNKVSEFICKPFENSDVLKSVIKIVSNTKASQKEKLEIGRDFADEAIPKVSEIENLLLSLEQNPKDAKSIHSIYCILHTLKGTAASIGLAYLAIFNHAYEARLLPIREEKESLTPQLISSLLAAQSHLLQYFYKLKQGEIMELMPFDEVLQFSSKDLNHKIEVAHINKINVDASMLNDFLEGVGELTIMRNLLLQRIEALSDQFQKNRSEWRFLINILHDMEKTQSNMQKGATDLLKVSFASLLPSLRRNIRDLCLKLDKKIRIETKGENALLDHNTIQVLSDSLVHLLRNSADHGIENPVERVEKGKSSEGLITIKISELGEKIKILISDDGRGIDSFKVKKKALENQLVTDTQLKNMNDQQINALIFEPGFSTADTVTEVSGRGIGMDMVKKSIQSIGGSVSVFSEYSQGTTFDIQIPKNHSLRIVKTFIVNSTKIQKFTFSFDEVIGIESADKLICDSRILKRNNITYALFQEEFVRVLELSEIKENAIIFFLKKETEKCAVMITNIVSSEETVLRDLGDLAETKSIFSKAAISGRHGTLLYLDIETINKLMGS